MVPDWRVTDIAAHLLDDDLRSLSMLIDNYFGESPSDPTSYDGLVKYLNRLNSDWVKSMQLETAAFSLGGAGETESYYWLHIAS